ncbi:MAG: DUF5320 domain-containing protein [Candidatus Peribacteraceae bacterium]|nr:DUF5320 domain-containing protein [Candidatus Peribacteraceae bacterium]MDD5742749.1 DUF5320 domain-containing protein [Candidatus Peribacteraceae bacterium]
MPARDGTGPAGCGPMTGWGRGPCCGTGRGLQRGFGRRGFCGFFGRQRPAPADEKKMLTGEIEATAEYLKGLQERQKELNGK